MKNTILLLGCLTLFCLSSCSDGTSTTTSQSPKDLDTTKVASEAASLSVSNHAICLWDKAGLREAPGRNKDIKYLETINFGEKVKLLGDSKEMPEEKRTYIQVELSDGQEGWVNEYLFAVEARLAAATGEISLYKRPEMTTLSDQVFEPGEVLALKEGSDGWFEAWGSQKKKSGWVKAGGLVTGDEKDLTAAIMMQRALQESNAVKQLEKLESLAANKVLSGSVFMSQITQAIEKAKAVTELPEDQMYILANKLNVRSAPDVDGDNVIFQLDEGAVVTILEKGSREQIRDMDDFWYKINHDGQEGWVFGSHTSKKLTP